MTDLKGFCEGRTSSLELGIIVGLACFCVNHTQLNSSVRDEQMAMMRRILMHGENTVASAMKSRAK